MRGSNDNEKQYYIDSVYYSSTIATLEFRNENVVFQTSSLTLYSYPYS